MTTAQELARLLERHSCGGNEYMDATELSDVCLDLRVDLKAMARELNGEFEGLNPTQILAVVARESGVGLPTLLSARRDRRVARPRQLSMHLSRKLCHSWSLAKIGAAHGRRDHKTVMHADELIGYLLTRDDKLARLRDRVMSELGL